MSDYIYLDNNATTKLDSRVLKAMFLDFKAPPQNPSSTHFLGKRAKYLLIQARRQMASLLSVKNEELVFTSGGTESMNLLIKGTVEALKTKASEDTYHIITTDVEHACVYNNVLELQKKGFFEVSFIKVGTYGSPTPKQVKDAIKDNTKVIIISAVNSETGVETDFEAIAKIAEEKNIALIIDGIAILGKKRFSIPKGITAMGFSGHKIHGPKGIGFVYISKKFPFHPHFLGGVQEYNKRAGTENLAGILGLAKALEIAYTHLDANCKKMQALRDLLETELKKELDITVNGKGPRICNTSNITFKSIEAEDMLIQLDLYNICASHGSACASNSKNLSRVLLNMGLNKEKAKSAIRFSLSKDNTLEDIERTIKIIINIIKKQNI